MSLRVGDDPAEEVLLRRVLPARELEVLGVVRLAVEVGADGHADVARVAAVRGDELEAVHLAVLVQVHVPAEGGVAVDDHLVLAVDLDGLRIPVPAQNVSAAHVPVVDGLAEVERHDRPRCAVEEAEAVLDLRDLVGVGLLEVGPPPLAGQVVLELEAVVQGVEVVIDRLSAVEHRLVGSVERVGLARVHRPRVERHADRGAGEGRAGGDPLRRGLGEIAQLHQHGAAVPALVQLAQVLPDAHQLGQPAVDAGGPELARLQVGERKAHRVNRR